MRMQVLPPMEGGLHTRKEYFDHNVPNEIEAYMGGSLPLALKRIDERDFRRERYVVR